MRSDLEKALVHLLNEETEQAEQLFHKYLVSKAREIHESLRESEDTVLDDEDYLDDGVDGFEDATDETSDEDAVADDLDDAEDELADASDDEGDEGDETDEGRLDDLEDELDRLAAQFKEFMDGDDSDTEADPDADADVEDTDDDITENDMEGEDDEEDFPDMTEGKTFKKDKWAEEDAKDKKSAYRAGKREDAKKKEVKKKSAKKDDFDDISESIVSELEKINVDLSDGKETDGKKITQNSKSNLPTKKADPANAGPIKIKQSAASGFNRETAPAVKQSTKRDNMAKGTKPVSKEGDKDASLNKEF